MERNSISTIIPVYQVEMYIKECVNSVLNQSMPAIEIILVDDGTGDVCGIFDDEYAIENKSIISVHQKNGGLSSARNTGLELASCDVVSFVDSDDVISERMYQTLINVMESTSCDIVAVNYTKNYKELSKSECDSHIHFFTASEAIKSCAIYGEIEDVVWNKLYKRELIFNTYFPVGKISEDVFFTYKILAKAKKVAKSSEKLYYYRQRSGSIMQMQFSPKWLDALEARIERYEFVKKEFPELTDACGMDVINTCIYDGQCAYKFLRGKQRQQVINVLKNILHSYTLPNEIKKNYNLKKKMWYRLAKSHFRITCFVRSTLGIGF